MIFPRRDSCGWLPARSFAAFVPILGADLPVAPGYHGGAVPGGGARRRAGTHSRRAHARGAWPAGRDRERRRRGRHPGERARGARHARWPYHHPRQSRHACRQRRDLSAAIRSRQGLRADRDAAEQSPAAHCQQGHAREGFARPDRAAQGQSRQGDVRQCAGPAARRISPRSISRLRSACASSSCPIAARRRCCRT